MQGRLGIYDKRPYEPQKTDPAISGVKEQAIKMRFNGGNKQQERMIKDKRRSLDRAVWYSYQAAEVVRTSAEYKKPVKDIINKQPSGDRVEVFFSKYLSNNRFPEFENEKFIGEGFFWNKI